MQVVGPDVGIVCHASAVGHDLTVRRESRPINARHGFAEPLEDLTLFRDPRKLPQGILLAREEHQSSIRGYGWIAPVRRDEEWCAGRAHGLERKWQCPHPGIDQRPCVQNMTGGRPCGAVDTTVGHVQDVSALAVHEDLEIAQILDAVHRIQDGTAGENRRNVEVLIDAVCAGNQLARFATARRDRHQIPVALGEEYFVVEAPDHSGSRHPGVGEAADDRSRPAFGTHAPDPPVAQVRDGSAIGGPDGVTRVLGIRERTRFEVGKRTDPQVPRCSIENVRPVG